jgi:peptide/nickel transport system substrate-binding protein
MDRRAFLARVGALAAAAGFATPAISQRAAARAVRLVPHADLANASEAVAMPTVIRCT